MSHKDDVLDVCRRIERALQRDWGSTGDGLRERLRSTRYEVPPELRKRIRYLHQLKKQALKSEKFRLKSPADFEAKGTQVLEELAQARKTAALRLRPWLRDQLQRYRLLVGIAVLALLLAAAGGIYLLLQPEPELPPVVVASPANRPAPRPAPKPAPKPIAAPPAPAPTAAASAPGPAPAASAPVAAAEPAPPPIDTQVHIEAPSQVQITLKRSEVVQGASGRDEIAVIVDVQNMGYASLARITFDASLYDTRSGKAVALITPTAPDAATWHVFMRQALRRGQGAEVRLSYSTTSGWSSEQAVALVKSGRYQIRLKAISLADGDNRSLPL